MQVIRINFLLHYLIPCNIQSATIHSLTFDNLISTTTTFKMLFSTILAAGLAQAMTASAATMMVTVAANNKFQFTPNSVTAQPGDMVAFNFVAQVRHQFR